MCCYYNRSEAISGILTGMPKRLIIIPIAIILLGVLTTINSYLIITDRNVLLDPLKPYVTITGERIVNLPCSPIGAVSWSSNAPILPETRGFPINYHFWNPCHGDKILLKGFVIDVLFWIFMYTTMYGAYILYSRQRT